MRITRYTAWLAGALTAVTVGATTLPASGASVARAGTGRPATVTLGRWTAASSRAVHGSWRVVIPREGLVVIRAGGNDPGFPDSTSLRLERSSGQAVAPLKSVSFDPDGFDDDPASVQLVRFLPAGTYLVSGVLAALYRLRVDEIPPQPTLLAGSLAHSAGRTYVVGYTFNGASWTRGPASLPVTFRDRRGRPIGHTTVRMLLPEVAPGGLDPLAARVHPPAGTVAASFGRGVDTSPTDRPTTIRASVSILLTCANADPDNGCGEISAVGVQLSNPTPYAVGHVTLATVWTDTEGALCGVGVIHVDHLKGLESRGWTSDPGNFGGADLSAPIGPSGPVLGRCSGAEATAASDAY